MLILFVMALAAAAPPPAKADPCNGSDTRSMAECMGGKIE